VAEDSRVTAAEIARTVGVGRAAVSNWRRRYLDFPKPAGGTPTSPTFSWAEIESWLKANGKLSRPAEQHADDYDDPASSAPLDDTRLARTMTGLIPELKTGLVLDPACGAGRLLTSVAGSAKADVAFAAQDGDSEAVEAVRDAFESISRTPVALEPGEPFLDDSLAEFRMRADVVLCAPPIGPQGPARPVPLAELTLDPRWEFGLPAPSDPGGVWTQICYSYLKPDGIAILLLPAVLAAKAAGRRIRAELVRRGVLQTVIGLPHRFALRVSGGLQIWILQRPSGPPDHQVRMVDLSDADDLPEGHTEWAAVFDDLTRSRLVSALDLLDDEVALVPARHVRLPVSDIVRRYEEAQNQLGSLLTRLIAEAPAFDPAERRAELPLTSLAELERAGALEMLGRDAGIRLMDIAIPASSDPLVVCGPHELEEVKRRDGLAEIIRCDPEQLDPFFVAAFLGSSTRDREGAATGSSARAAVRKARVPRLPLAEQRRFAAAFRRISDWTRLFRQASQLGEETTGWALHGLTMGVLDPGPASED
jgi:SAM-dependent methyltransferase